LVGRLVGAGAQVAILTRDPRRAADLWPGLGIELRRADLTDPSTLRGLLDAIDTVFHLASHSPSPGEPAIYEAPAHWPVTALGTRHLVAAASAGKVRSLVYVSSVMAMGDAAGARGEPADERIEPRPETLYGRAKLAAERSVLAGGSGRPGHAVVVRLPMVYGLDGQGNVARLIDAVARRRFPPWPRIANRRSAIHVDDAVAAVLRAAQAPPAAGQVYLVTDGHAYSTRGLYEQIQAALDRAVPGWSVPLWGLEAVAALGSVAERLAGVAMPLTRAGLSKLTGDAWYCSDKICRELGFAARYSLAQEIPTLVRRYLEARAMPGNSVPPR
ncbi:MAG TPA: NAD-dependent epimerase/dehydratase family protein, partial [Lamprocystis sp. (in: g-proteobacteria)]|nr:NAD-dependent epimerase/dehydratase family protein [Lamprocystis sp. (in: g-proteobacteria)]